MKCRQYNSNNIINNGKERCKQSHNCKSYKFNFVEIDGYTGKNIDNKKWILSYTQEIWGLE